MVLMALKLDLRRPAVMNLHQLGAGSAWWGQATAWGSSTLDLLRTCGGPTGAVMLGFGDPLRRQGSRQLDGVARVIRLVL